MTNLFKITSIRVFKMKTYMFLLIIQLNKLQTKVKMRLCNTNCAEQIHITCDKMTFCLQTYQEKTVRIRLTSNVGRMAWTAQITSQTTNKLTAPKMNALWVESISAECRTRNKHRKIMLLRRNFLQMKFINN